MRFEIVYTVRKDDCVHVTILYYCTHNCLHSFEAHFSNALYIKTVLKNLWFNTFKYVVIYSVCQKCMHVLHTLNSLISIDRKSAVMY
jgi:hypothetical protein